MYCGSLKLSMSKSFSKKIFQGDSAVYLFSPHSFALFVAEKSGGSSIHLK